MLVRHYSHIEKDGSLFHPLRAAGLTIELAVGRSTSNDKKRKPGALLKHPEVVPRHPADMCLMEEASTWQQLVRE